MDTFSFDSLSSVQFEEFCYDLLAGIDAERIGWRKGTGLKSSPADQGRDIECYFKKTEPDGSPRTEHWFVECKHHKQGVSPSDIEGALAWASAKRPDVLLIIASNALSNPCKAYLEDYITNNRPLFRIKIWEHKDLERLTIGKPDLLRKYGLTSEFPFLKLLHPAHIRFLRHPPLNTLRYFFAVLEKAGPHRFQDMFSMVRLLVLKPTVKIPTDGHQTLRDLLQSPISYVDFRDKCYGLAQIVEQSFLVRAIVNEVLSSAFSAGDKTDLDRIMQNHKILIQKTEQELNENPNSTIFNQKSLEEMQSRMARLPSQIDESYRHYVEFCEEVVAPLFSEEVQLPPEVIARAEKMLGKKIIVLKKGAKQQTD